MILLLFKTNFGNGQPFVKNSDVNNTVVYFFNNLMEQKSNSRNIGREVGSERN